MNQKFAGTGVALITPFNQNNQVDFSALAKLIDYVSSNGVDYLVVLGTTAETPTLNSDEKQQIIDFVTTHNTKKLPVVVGIGGNNTDEVIKTIHKTNLKGVDAILSVTPYYNKPSQQGIYEHYKVIATESPLPVILYNVPGRTGINMTADTTLKLAHEFKNIIGIKEASGNMSQIAYILRDRPNGFLVISGDDGLTMPQIAMGVDGVISVAANGFPADFAKMVNKALQSKCSEAACLHLKLIEPIDLLFAEGNPVGVKAVLNLRGIIQNYLRLPLVPASDGLMKKLQKFIQ